MKMAFSSIHLLSGVLSSCCFSQAVYSWPFIVSKECYLHISPLTESVDLASCYLDGANIYPNAH